MWFRFCVTIVLVHVIGSNLTKHDPKDVSETNKEEAEAIFAGVIKNISRVNHVLQELINNYEHLQKIYKSQENLESESTDGEVDEVFKNKKDSNGRERSKTETPATSRKPDGYPATQMIWSDNDKDEDDDDDTSDSDSEKAENVKENQTAEKSPHKPQQPAIQKQAEIIFIDTRMSTTKKKKKKPTLEPILEIPTSKAPKTRYSKVSHLRIDSAKQQEHKNKKKKENSYLTIEDPIKNNIKRNNQLSEIKTSPKSNVDPKRNVEKKMQSETFSPMNIWDDIINNKPIQLQAHSEVIFDKLRKDNNDNNSNVLAIQKSREISKANGNDQRRKDTKPELVIIANDNQTEMAKRSLSNSSETDEDGFREEFQATVLREAYGDACLKVVVKKCFKACKEAGKEICERYKCKSNYKEKFKEYIKKGCIKEFVGNTSEKIEADDKGGDADSSKAQFRASSPDEYKDITRNGYLSYCLPHLQTGSRRSGDLTDVSSETKPSYSSDPVLAPNLNILRDRYERACQKISHEKCKNACEYAYKKICQAFTCNTERKKAYKKQCYQQCKAAYNKGRNRGSSSDSSGSGDSSGSSNSSSSE